MTKKRKSIGAKSQTQDDAKENKYYSIHEMHPEFETYMDAEQESLIRQRCLVSRTTKRSHRLAEKLAGCLSEAPCGSAACPFCFREYREWLFNETMQATVQGGDFKSITLIFYQDWMKSKELSEFEPHKLKNRLSKKFCDIGLKGPVIGGIELDYHECERRWLPHMHLLIPDQPSALSKLRAYMTRDCNQLVRDGVQNRPMHEAQLKDLADQQSYVLKSFWMSLRAYTYMGKRYTKKYRLDSARLARSLRELDRLGFSKLTVKYGLKHQGTRFKQLASSRNKD